MKTYISAIAISFILLLQVPAFSLSNIYLDLNGAYTDAGDLETLPGFGLTLAYAIHENVNIFYRNIFSATTKDPNKPEETEYRYNMYLAGFQYRYRISESPAFWIINAAAGWTQAEYSIKQTDIEESDDGIAFAISTGILVEATQNVSVYLEAGYHYASYTGAFSEADVKGFQFLLGIRFTVWGKNRPIFEGY